MLFSNPEKERQLQVEKQDIVIRAGIFKQSMGARNRVGPPGYIDWRNSFLEIDS
jgi:hypothetical protein